MRSNFARKRNQFIAFSIFRAAIYLNVLALALFLGFIAINGISAISWEFLTEHPRKSMTEGGIWPCIVGTVYISLGSILVAFPLGVGTAIYLNEFSGGGRWTRIIRMGIINLAGVPSVVYGLFGLAFFVLYLNMGVSLLAGSLTLGAFILPLIIGSAEEALRNVPQSYREASLALGATKWQTVYRMVLPAALPSMLTGMILGVSRAAGETAPIMFTAAVFYTGKIPSSIFDEIMAMPYHIYVLATAGVNIDQTRPLQYGTALTLMFLVLGLNLVAILVRNKLQRRL
ncbi:phosphate ABC transporter, inner membrane subunit PstA [Desulfonatronospira thiodismutans ASO3-1]|uniref:Phosphate transport system permease protein PstA n=2 Tax=Desulfonatronospira TaxID=488937 RepID=D6SMD3_9BACT|nr:phosphate ABC transporter permease PstA [Desulfonatronospira thiodismutans]EFI35844.1 phosphate ABC transporter, inner membrane subunit PstA [Desulfonatronospira thiodismutans ASO3-1]